MLQQYEVSRDSKPYEKPVADTPRDGERTLKANILCWNYNKKGHQKSKCRKRKAELRNNGCDGRRNGEQAHVAHIDVAATALVDSEATNYIVNDVKLVTERSYKVNTSIQTATNEFFKPKYVGKGNLGLGLNTEIITLNLCTLQASLLTFFLFRSYAMMATRSNLTWTRCYSRRMTRSLAWLVKEATFA